MCVRILPLFEPSSDYKTRKHIKQAMPIHSEANIIIICIPLRSGIFSFHSHFVAITNIRASICEQNYKDNNIYIYKYNKCGYDWLFLFSPIQYTTFVRFSYIYYVNDVLLSARYNYIVLLCCVLSFFCRLESHYFLCIWRFRLNIINI